MHLHGAYFRVRSEGDGKVDVALPVEKQRLAVTDLVNGRAQPEPFRLKAGLKYRLRFINITPNGAQLQVSLLTGSSPVRWRAVAKDGADLPPAQALEQEARQKVSVGETYDFEFQPTAKGDLRLEVLRPFNRTWAVAEVQVR
jgi:FtsP/CotA-like multicopper oxidase with cupredoxin domain